MKYILFKCAIFLLCFLAVEAVSAEVLRITDENIPFLYEARIKTRVPDDTLAKYISSDYENAKDEFTRRDLFQQIKPVIEERIREAKQTTEVHLRISATLGTYDFERESFPTGLTSPLTIEFENRYSVILENLEGMDLIEMPLIEAKKLSQSLRKSRTAVFDVYGVIVGTKMELGDWTKTPNKFIKVKMKKFEARHISGKKLE